MTLTAKQKILALVMLLLVAVLLAGIIYFVRQHSGLQGGKVMEATTSFIFSLLALVIVAWVSLAFKPVQEWVTNWAAQPSKKANEVRVLLFGQTGVGKTAFAKHVYTLEPLAAQGSTERFFIFDQEVNLGKSRSVQLLMADYRGQEPSQVTVDMPEKFAGQRGSRVIDILILMVDLIGREYDTNIPQQILSDDQLLDWLSESPREKLERRFNQHNAYLSAPVIEILFSTVFGPQLRKVCFVVTKSDLISRAIKMGAISGENSGDPSALVGDIFKDVISRVDAACTRNKLPQCSFHLISVNDQSARGFACNTF